MWEMSEVPAARDRQRRIFFDVESSGCGFVGLRHVYSLPHRYSYSFPFSKMLNRCDRCRLPIHITVSYISQMKWREEKKRKNEFKVDAPSAVVSLMISRYRNDRMGGIMAHAMKYMPHTHWPRRIRISWLIANWPPLQQPLPPPSPCGNNYGPKCKQTKNSNWNVASSTAKKWLRNAWKRYKLKNWLIESEPRRQTEEKTKSRNPFGPRKWFFIAWEIVQCVTHTYIRCETPPNFHRRCWGRNAIKDVVRRDPWLVLLVLSAHSQCALPLATSHSNSIRQ